MGWERIKNIFGGAGKSGSDTPQSPKATEKGVPSKDIDENRAPEIPWLTAADNQWGVPLLDVRPITFAMLSTSSDPKCASNAISYGSDDGTAFIGQAPMVDRSVATSIRFPIDRLLADGVLFAPSVMEHKWALFYRQGQIICVRSWLRKVAVIAELEARRGEVEITKIHGAFTEQQEDATFTTRVFDYLIRSHALNMAYPVPLPTGIEKDPNKAAMWCFSMFGKLAAVATPQEFERKYPEKPLRTHSLLHIAVARRNIPAIKSSLTAGMPVDLLAGDGLAPLHWSLVSDDLSIARFLVEQGSPIDVRSDQGATPLMNAVQRDSLAAAFFLLDHGADVNAQDRRGFTALHRAAEMGKLDMVRALLERGASPDLAADGHTARSLAEARNQKEIVALLN
jgi:hypothetical protein